MGAWPPQTGAVTSHYFRSMSSFASKPIAELEDLHLETEAGSCVGERSTTRRRQSGGRPFSENAFPFGLERGSGEGQGGYSRSSGECRRSGSEKNGVLGKGRIVLIKPIFGVARPWKRSVSTFESLSLSSETKPDPFQFSSFDFQFPVIEYASSWKVEST